MESGKAPQTDSEFTSASLIFRGWCAGIVEQEQWSKAVEFGAWIKNHVKYSHGSEDDEAFRSSFKGWLSNGSYSAGGGSWW
jgi:hypothetical protein